MYSLYQFLPYNSLDYQIKYKFEDFKIWIFSFFKFKTILNEPPDLGAKKIGEMFSLSSCWHSLITHLNISFFG